DPELLAREVRAVCDEAISQRGLELESPVLRGASELQVLTRTGVERDDAVALPQPREGGLHGARPRESLEDDVPERGGRPLRDRAREGHLARWVAQAELDGSSG